MVFGFGGESGEEATVCGNKCGEGTGKVSGCTVFHNPAVGIAVVVPDNPGFVHPIFGYSQVGGLCAVYAKVQTDTVFLRIVVAYDVVGEHRVVTGTVTVGVYGLQFRSVEGVTSYTGRAGARLVVHNEQKVFGAIVVERDIERELGPTASRQLNGAAEHKVGGGYGYPVDVVAEGRLVRVYEVHIVVADLACACIIEGYAENGTRTVDF